MFEDSLHKTSSIRIHRAKFVIKQLSPSLFLDKDYMFPMSNVQEKKESIPAEYTATEIMTYKSKIADVLLLGVARAYKKAWFGWKKVTVSEIIKEVMNTPEIYSYLFAEIVNLTLELKKKNLLSVSRLNAKALYTLGKTFQVLPSEILKLKPSDYCFNLFITSIGREEEYRDELIKHIASLGVKVQGTETIKRLEQILEQENKRGKRR